MERTGFRIPAGVLELVHDESKLTWENLARELDCTTKSVYRWRERGLNLDALVSLLRFATERGLERSEVKLAHALKDACGPNVQVLLLARRRRRTA